MTHAVTEQVTGGLFGAQAKPSLFGATSATTQSSFAFGAAAATPQVGGGLFGAKPGASTTAFSFAAPTSSTQFGINVHTFSIVNLFMLAVFILYL